MSKNTSWSNVAGWYDELLKDSGTYQAEMILPALLRLIQPKKGMQILDVACGQGFFARAFAEAGASVTGVDASAELVARAKKNCPSGSFFVSPADKLPMFKDKTADNVVIVLALQNIENFSGVLSECQRVLKPGGSLFVILNHPAFRIPKQSSWGYDEKQNVQYRRIDRYLSESKVEIDMQPSDPGKVMTTSFHRPLQVYAKAFRKNGFAIGRIEEWTSGKKSETGSRQVAEDRSRKEIPLFMMIEAVSND